MLVKVNGRVLFICKMHIKILFWFWVITFLLIKCCKSILKQYQNSNSFHRYMRMWPEDFEVLLQLVGQSIAKENTKMRESISRAERLTMSIPYLAHGSSQFLTSACYRCGCLWNMQCNLAQKLHETTHFSWRVSKGFRDVWNFPHCSEEIDGKHVRIKCPPNSASLHYNLKGSFSTLLLAICDASYCFTLETMAPIMTVVFLEIRLWGNPLRIKLRNYQKLIH